MKPGLLAAPLPKLQRSHSLCLYYRRADRMVKRLALKRYFRAQSRGWFRPARVTCTALGVLQMCCKTHLSYSTEG